MIMKVFPSPSMLLILSLLSLIYVLLLLQDKTITNLQPSMHIRNMFSGSDSSNSLEAKSKSSSCACSNVARVGTIGYWRVRNDVGENEIRERKNMDKEMRLKLAWPGSLYRNDSRCGLKFPIPGFRVQGTCDPESATPCCHHPSGNCSSQPEHCSCSECTDYRTRISAELAEWVPSDNTCVVRNFTQKMTCDLLNKFQISIAFIGDSLIRQLSRTLLLFLTGNSRSGLIPAKASRSDREKCHDDHQITKLCSVKVTAHSLEELGIGSICNGSVNFEWALVENYKKYLPNDDVKKVTEYLGRNNSFVVLAVGLHYRLHLQDVIRKYVDKLLTLIETKGNGWPKVIWMGIHAVPDYLLTEPLFNNKGILEFNYKLHDYLEKRNVTVIDTFYLTNQLRSYDGLHYGIGLNHQKMHVLLNHIGEFYGEC